MNKDISAPPDRGEPTTAMEPLLIAEGSRHRGALSDLAFDLVARSSGFRRSLPDGVRLALADLVRSMNCYYSSLIEGHYTHPIDIERALRNDYSKDRSRRDLQVEARAHIEVQRWIDGGGVSGRATATESICEVHRRFCHLLPDELRWVDDPVTHERMEVRPGELRGRDVKVGTHVPVSPGAIPRFLARFENVYRSSGRTDGVIGIAAAHHRLLWIHPFLDGNGRVARLISHAMLLDALDTGGIWSAARGLARNVATYKEHLARCDLPRRNDLDGRGALGAEALADFTRFFLETCIDQVAFMESLVEPDRLRARILMWVEEEVAVGKLAPRAGQVLSAILYRGELPRGEVAGLVGSGDRHARRTVAALSELGIIASDGPRAPLRIAFPATLAPRLMPGLFPERPT
jgi:Fic family protein